MMDNQIPYHVAEEPGRLRAIMLAVFIHAVLFTFLWVGTHRQNDLPKAVVGDPSNPQTHDVALQAATPLANKRVHEIRETSPDGAEISSESKDTTRLQNEPDVRNNRKNGEIRPTKVEKAMSAKTLVANEKRVQNMPSQKGSIQRRQVLLERVHVNLGKQVTEKYSKRGKSANDDVANTEIAKAERRQSKIKENEIARHRKLDAEQARRQATADAGIAAQQRKAELKRITVANFDGQKNENRVWKSRQPREGEETAERQQSKDKSSDAANLAKLRQAELDRITSDPDGSAASNAATKSQ